MFVDDEERISDLYRTPNDRKTVDDNKVSSNDSFVAEDNSIVLEMSNSTKKKIEPSVRDSKTEVPLSLEEIELKKKKKKLVFFILMMILNVAFFGYIIYLIVTTFMSL